MRKSHESLPVVIENFTESAKSYARRLCNANMQHVEAQNEQMLQQVQSNLAAVQKAWAIGQDVWEFIAETNYQAHQTHQQQTQQDILIQLMLLEDAWNSAAQAAYVNQIQQERNYINSLKSTVALLRPWTESMKAWGAEQEGTIQIGINYSANVVANASLETGVAMDLQGNIGIYETHVCLGTDIPNLWEARFSTIPVNPMNPVYDHVSLSATGALTVMNTPSLDGLSGIGTSTGFSVTTPDHITGGVSFVTSGIVDNETYWGFSFSGGLATSPGADIHTAITYTQIEYINVYDVLLEIYNNIERINVP